MRTLTQTKVEVFTTTQRSHPDYHACVRTKQSLRMLGIEYDEIHPKEEELIDYARMVGSEELYPFIRVSSDGELIERTFGFDPSFLVKVRQIVIPKAEDLIVRTDTLDEEQETSYRNHLTRESQQRIDFPTFQTLKEKISKILAQKQKINKVSIPLDGLMYQEIKAIAKAENKSVRDITLQLTKESLSNHSQRFRQYETAKGKEMSRRVQKR